MRSASGFDRGSATGVGGAVGFDSGEASAVQAWAASGRALGTVDTADVEAVARALEPGAPTPVARFEALRALSEAGIPTGLALAPLIPRLNDGDVPELLRRAREAGARYAFFVLLRLPAEVLPVFRERLEEALPERARAVLSALAQMRGGKLRESRFGERMRGRGPRYQAVADLFRLQCKRLGLCMAGDDELEERQPAPRPRQPSLFEDG